MEKEKKEIEKFFRRNKEKINLLEKEEKEKNENFLIRRKESVCFFCQEKLTIPKVFKEDEIKETIENREEKKKVYNFYFFVFVDKNYEETCEKCCLTRKENFIIKEELRKIRMVDQSFPFCSKDYIERFFFACQMNVSLLEEKNGESIKGEIIAKIGKEKKDNLKDFVNLLGIILNNPEELKRIEQEYQLS